MGTSLGVGFGNKWGSYRKRSIAEGEGSRSEKDLVRAVTYADWSGTDGGDQSGIGFGLSGEEES